MKYSLAIGVTLLATQAYASQCAMSDYVTYIPEFFTGLQQDPDDTSGDCRQAATTMANKMTLWGQSFSGLSLDNFMEPAYVAAEFGQTAADVFLYCDTTTFALNWADRFGSVAGFADLIATIGTAWFKNNQGQTSELYTSYNALATAADCQAQSKLVGVVIKNLFNYTVTMEYLANEVKDSFSDQWAS